MKNRLFFFGAWEGQYQTTPQQFFYNVPPAALRVGDFSQAFNPDGSLQVIYDPRTGNPDGTGRVPFPGNVIPGGAASIPSHRRFRHLYPLPNTDGQTSGGNVGGAASTRNFERSLPRKFDRNNYDLKMNWNPSSAAQVWGKYEHMGANVKALTAVSAVRRPRATATRTVNMYTFGTTWTLNSTTVFDATYGISRMTHQTIAGDFALRQLRSRRPRDSGHERRRQFQQRPALRRHSRSSPTRASFDSLGNADGWDPVHRDERTYALSANITKVQRTSRNQGRLLAQPAVDGPLAARARRRSARPAGCGDECDGAERRARKRANVYNGYAAFLLGLVGHAGESVQNELMTTREWQHALYVRDRWQVNTQADARSRPSLRVLPADDARRPRHRTDRRRQRSGEHAGVDIAQRPARRRSGGVPKDLGIKVSKTPVRAAPRRHLPPQ